MNQSAVLVASLVAAFVLYVAARGRLANYSAVVFGPVKQADKGSGKDGGKSDTEKAVDITKTAVEVAAYL